MPKFEPIDKVISDLCLRSGDLLFRSKGVYRNVANDVWNDMNEDALKKAKRVKIQIGRRQVCGINKRTNSVDLPCDSLQLCSVNLIGAGGQFFPVFQNGRLNDDIPTIEQAPNCACEYNCGYRLCNMIKGYEAVQVTRSDFLPNGTPISFNCVDRKVVVGGILYTEAQFPLRRYVSGVWVDTVLETKQAQICELDCDNNGCVYDTEQNINTVVDTCCGVGNNNINGNIPIGGTATAPPQANDNTWIYYCNSKLDWFAVQCGGFERGFRRDCQQDIYNISELGNRIIFPSNFGFGEVMIRYYEDIALDDLQIPYVAKQTYMAGLQYFAAEFNPKMQQLVPTLSTKYAKYKLGLMNSLNLYRIAEQRMILTPPVFFPSYLPIRGTYGGSGWQNFGWY